MMTSYNPCHTFSLCYNDYVVTYFSYFQQVNPNNFISSFLESVIEIRSTIDKSGHLMFLNRYRVLWQFVHGLSFSFKTFM